MKKLLIIGALLFPVLASCAPTAAIRGVTVTPVLVKVSESASVGGTVTLQGRYLGGPATGRIRIGANVDASGGVVLPASAIQSWTDSQIVFTVPANVPTGGSYLFVEVGDMRSTALPFSVKQ